MASDPPDLPAGARPLLVIVTGPPGAGKTTLGRRLAERVRLPYISKDGFKETLFETLGWSDRDWSQRLGAASVALLYHVAEALLAAGQSLIVESNFWPALANPRMLALQRAYGCDILQLYCTAAPDVLTQRYRARWQNGERHPGHVEDTRLADFDAALRADAYAPLSVGGRMLTVDTTDFAAVDEQALVAAVRAALADASGA